MIARSWAGVIPANRADEYYGYIKATGIPGLTETPGNRGVYVFQRQEGNEMHIVMISLWDSLEDISAFAGEDISQARFYPEDHSFLTQFDKKVIHYEVLGFHPAQPQP